MQSPDKHILQLILGGTVLLIGLFATLVYILLRNSQKLNINYAVSENILAESRNEIVRERDRVMNEISREIHDNIGELLHSASIKLYLAKRRESDPVQVSTLNEIIEYMKMAIQEASSISHALNDDYLKAKSLHIELELLVERAKSHQQINFSFQVEGNARKLHPQQKLLVLRIAQEAMQNIHKHANATEAVLLLRYGPSSFIMSIKDNGIGLAADTSQPGIGLTNMKARAESLGGTLYMDSVSGAGCTVTLMIPNIEFMPILD